MKKTILIVLAVLAVALAAGCPAPTANPSPSPSPTPQADFSVELTLHGPSVSPGAVYAAWIEDASGADLQNIYVCNRVVGRDPDTGALWQSGKGLQGDGLPYWLLSKYDRDHAGSGNKVIDGITGASTQLNLSPVFTRDVAIGAVRKFKVCLEIDRSLNNNTYFGDRPAFFYSTTEIDLDNLQSSYTLNLTAWMANDTTGGYGQQPLNPLDVPEFLQYTLINDFTHLGPTNDMVSDTAPLSVVRVLPK